MEHDSQKVIEQDPRRKQLKDEYVKRRGWWAPFWDDFLALDVEMFEAFLEFGSVAWKKGHLPPKVKEFIYIAIDSATTSKGSNAASSISVAVHFPAPDAMAEAQNAPLTRCTEPEHKTAAACPI